MSSSYHGRKRNATDGEGSCTPVAALAVHVGTTVMHGQAVATVTVTPDGHGGRPVNVTSPINGEVLERPAHIGDHVDAHATPCAEPKPVVRRAVGAR